MFGPGVYVRGRIGDQVDAAVEVADGIEVWAAMCGRERRVRVEESGDGVRVRVEHRRTDDENECLDVMLVPLAEPLGGERIVDVTSGRLVPVCPSTDSPWHACVP